MSCLNSIQNDFVVRDNKHKGEAVLRKHLQEHDHKAALSSEIRKSGNKPRISESLAT